MHPGHPREVDRRGMPCPCRCSWCDFSQQMCFGGRNAEAESCPPAASSHLLVWRRGSAVPRGLAGVRSVWQPKAPSLRARPGGISCATLPGDKRWPRGRYPTGPAPGGSGCPPRGAVGLVQLAMHVACEQRWLRGTVSVRPQQEGGMNGFSENLHHLMTGYSFIYMIFLLTVTNNCYTSQTPRAINNFSPGAIFLKRWHIRSLYVGPCSKSPF